MKYVKFYTGRKNLPVFLLPLVIILILILASFFAVIGLVSLFVIGIIGLGLGILNKLRSKNHEYISNYDSSTNTITLDEKDYKIEK